MSPVLARAVDDDDARDLATVARRLYSERRTRDRLFGSAADLFRDPAWDVILFLYIAQEDARPVSLSSAAIASAIPMTTALRCLEAMVGRGLVIRGPDLRDGRRSLVSLADTARQVLEDYLRIVDDQAVGRRTRARGASRLP